METLLNTDFFQYMNNPEGPTYNTNNLEWMYKNFIQTLFTLCKSEKDRTNLFLILNYIHIELLFMQNEEIMSKSKKK
jgi:hypothetical protein